MAAQVPPVQHEGLSETLSSVVLTGGPLHRPVLARSLRARDAGLLLELAGLEVAGARLLQLPNAAPVTRMAEAANVLLLLHGFILPTLRDHPTSASVLRIVEASAVKLMEHARAAGGGFRRAAAVLVDRLVAFVALARALPPHAPDGGLREGVDDIKEIVKALLDAMCTIRIDDQAAGGGAN